MKVGSKSFGYKNENDASVLFSSRAFPLATLITPLFRTIRYGALSKPTRYCALLM